MFRLRRLLSLAAALIAISCIGLAYCPGIHGEAPSQAPAVPSRFSMDITDPSVADRPVGAGSITPVTGGPNGGPALEVKGLQYGYRITTPAFVDSDTTITWSWRKTTGRICVLQLAVANPETGVTRYFGYGAGLSSESLSADPTVEIFVSDQVPTEWTKVTRNLGDDIHRILGWNSAKITEVYFSPWDGDSGLFAGGAIDNLLASDSSSSRQGTELAQLSSIGKGRYSPPKLKGLDEKRELRYDTHFEELAPGRNSASNEWSAYGWPQNQAFNNIGRDMRVRYPAYDLVFRMYDGAREIKPDSLDSFRLGLVRGNLPAIWGGWEYEGLRYRVSVMAVPFNSEGAYDLYKLEINNPGRQPVESKLAAGLDGPPDMKLDGGVVSGLGGAPFMLADAPAATDLMTRDWGLCDKRAKSYQVGGGPGQTEPAVSSTRIGMDGLPVIYRFKAEQGKDYKVCLAASPHIAAILGAPAKAGDLVFRYEVEGAPYQDLDWTTYIGAKARPLYCAFAGVRDVDGDGYITVKASNSPDSRIKHTRLSAIYVFPSDAKIDDPEQVYSGAMNGKCLQHIDVGVTPECDWANQNYDMSDVGLCRLKLGYGGRLAAGETKTYWLKVPPIYRRDPVSMGSYGHAFLDVLPGEAAPPFGQAKMDKLRAADPSTDWNRVVGYWDRFFGRMAQIETPDKVLKDMFTSRLATRNILDVKIAKDVYFNACSPWFYYDFAYRDQAYVVCAYDMAGLHDLAERLLSVYCMDSKNVPLGPISFGGVRLQLGMLPDGQWVTRPGQFDTQGQNLWCMVEHYKLSGDSQWLAKTGYPYIKRGAQWIVNSRHRHMAEIKNPNDPRYGLIQPGAMEVGAITTGMHMYYMDAWAILGLREASDAARSLGLDADSRLFATEADDLKRCLAQSMRKTFRREGLYQGRFWYGVEEVGDGMYGMWAHTPLVWPTQAVDPHDPMLTATWRELERMANQWGGGMLSDSEGGCWPYIGVDWAISYILRGEPEETLDYFCAFTDTAGLTMSWGEGYTNSPNLAAGDQPHFWADAQWVNLYRHLFAMEDGSTLLLTPATLRRWQQNPAGIAIRSLPTEFGDLRLVIKPAADRRTINYTFSLTPKGDQAHRALDKIVVNARTPNGCRVEKVTIDGRPTDSFTGESVIIAHPQRNHDYHLQIVISK